MRTPKIEQVLEQAFLDASQNEAMCQVDLLLLDLTRKGGISYNDLLLVHKKGITYKDLVDSCRWIAETADKALAKADL